MPISKLYVLCGLPFSGKTTFARSVPHAEILSRDTLMEQILASTEAMAAAKQRALEITHPVSQLYSDKSQNAFNDALTELYTKEVVKRLATSQSETAIVDGMHLQPLSRAFVHSVSAKEKIAVIFTTPLEICLQRFHQSNKPPSLIPLPPPLPNSLQPTSNALRSTLTSTAISRLATVFIPPTVDEGFDRILTRG